LYFNTEMRMLHSGIMKCPAVQYKVRFQSVIAANCVDHMMTEHGKMRRQQQQENEDVWYLIREKATTNTIPFLI